MYIFMEATRTTISPVILSEIFSCYWLNFLFILGNSVIKIILLVSSDKSFKIITMIILKK